jgi:large subunit ribosomal protein L10
MPTVRKAKTIESLAESMQNANLVVLTDYRGLSVSDLQNLRSSLRPVDGEFRIAKNTLTRIAAEQVGIEGLDPILEGPLALGFANGDIVGFAKAITDFAKSSRILTVKGGILDGKVVPAASIDSLSTMPSKEALQATFLGMLKSPMRGLVTVLNGPSQSMAYLLQARADQLAASGTESA